MDFNTLRKEKPAARNKKLQEQLLNHGNNFDSLSIGDEIICIEERKNGRYGGYVGFHDGNYEKAVSVTFGKKYRVVDINKKDRKIKIKTDDDAERWMGIKRFLFSIKRQRREKLKEIFKNLEK